MMHKTISNALNFNWYFWFVGLNGFFHRICVPRKCTLKLMGPCHVHWLIENAWSSYVIDVTMLFPCSVQLNLFVSFSTSFIRDTKKSDCFCCLMAIVLKSKDGKCGL